jgi:hypothetical protein
VAGRGAHQVAVDGGAVIQELFTVVLPRVGVVRDEAFMVGDIGQLATVVEPPDVLGLASRITARPASGEETVIRVARRE